MRAAGGVLLIAGALALGGCGEMSRGEFASEADGICQERLDAISGLTSSDDAVADQRKVVDIYEKEYEDLDDLSPPSGLSDRFDEMVDLLGEGVERHREIGRRLEANDQLGANSALAEVGRTYVRAYLIARRDLGLIACGKRYYSG